MADSPSPASFRIHIREKRNHHRRRLLTPMSFPLPASSQSLRGSTLRRDWESRKIKAASQFKNERNLIIK
uniref:Uncharacterized protein n=1 Tax=Oryza nivara TaxID=4536 RepID=A0A0E0GCL3_ORYNI